MPNGSKLTPSFNCGNGNDGAGDSSAKIMMCEAKLAPSSSWVARVFVHTNGTAACVCALWWWCRAELPRNVLTIASADPRQAPQHRCSPARAPCTCDFLDDPRTQTAIADGGSDAPGLFAVHIALVDSLWLCGVFDAIVCVSHHDG